MANISNCAHRSRLAQTQSSRGGASGFHHNPQAFDHMAGTRLSSAQAYRRKNWHYMTPAMEGHASRLSTKFVTASGQEIGIDRKTGQFEMAV